MYQSSLLGAVFICLGIVLGFAGLSAEASQEPQVGTPVAELLAEKGQPTGEVTFGKKRILKWLDLKVTVEDGLVTSVEHLNPLEEQQKSEQRKRVAALRMAEIQKRKEALSQPAKASQDSQPVVAKKGPSKEAVEALVKSAGEGNQNAQIKLGTWYRLGKGVNKDPYKAVDWFRKASEQGDADGDYYLGVMYANGEGVPKSMQTALKFLEDAARRGEARSKILLGKLYEEGRIGGFPDYERAYYWYTRASMSNLSEGSRLRKAIKPKLTDEELKRADNRAAMGIKYESVW